MSAPVMWFEVGGTELEEMRTFYGELFGWTAAVDDGYGMVDTGSTDGIPGGVWAPGEPLGTYTTFYVQVPDVDKALRHATDLGGEIVMPATGLPNGGTIGQIKDPQGQRVGLMAPPA